MKTLLFVCKGFCKNGNPCKRKQKNEYCHQHCLLKTLNETAEESVDDICSICFDKPQSKIVLECKHEFCESCINTWISKTQSSCPLCRKTLNNETVNNAFNWGIKMNILYPILKRLLNLSYFSDELQNKFLLTYGITKFKLIKSSEVYKCMDFFVEHDMNEVLFDNYQEEFCLITVDSDKHLEKIKTSIYFEFI